MSGAAVIAPAAERALIEAARAALPEEACGVLFGRDAGGAVHVAAALPLANRAALPATAFRIDPADLVTARRRAAPDGDLIGFFHSHPASPAEPSASDLREAAGWPGYLHAIVGAPAPGRAELRLYRVGAGAWTPLELERQPWPSS